MLVGRRCGRSRSAGPPPAAAAGAAACSRSSAPSFSRSSRCLPCLPGRFPRRPAALLPEPRRRAPAARRQGACLAHPGAGLRLNRLDGFSLFSYGAASGWCRPQRRGSAEGREEEDMRYLGRAHPERVRGLVRSGRRATAAAAAEDLVNHSPDGTEWGYAGSGPAQLALALLAHALADDALAVLPLSGIQGEGGGAAARGRLATDSRGDPDRGAGLCPWKTGWRISSGNRIAGSSAGSATAGSGTRPRAALAEEEADSRALWAELEEVQGAVTGGTPGARRLPRSAARCSRRGGAAGAVPDLPGYAG